jgi:hypothetical protein
VKVEDHTLGLVARDRDLDAANLHGLLLDIGGHRYLRHQRVERSSHGRDIGSGVRPALAQDGIQLALLFFAHQQTSPQASTPLRLAHDRRDLGERSSPEAGDSTPGVALNCRLARTRNSAIEGDGTGWPAPAHARLPAGDRFCGAPVARITMIG